MPSAFGSAALRFVKALTNYFQLRGERRVLHSTY